MTAFARIWSAGIESRSSRAASGLWIDGQLRRGGPLDGTIGRLRARRDAGDVLGALEPIDPARAAGDQPSEATSGAGAPAHYSARPQVSDSV